MNHSLKNQIHDRTKAFRLSAFVLLLVFLTGCGMQKEKKQSLADQTAETLNIRQMQSVCELATLECYYHNTAKLDSEKQVLFWNTSKKLWIEYSGIVKIGVDINKLDLKVKDLIVTITLPEAKIFSCKVDETSLSEDTFYSEEKGLGGSKVTAEDQSEAFAQAQQNMLEMVQQDETLLFQARERAQTLLLNYVKNIGDAIGTDYEVQWDFIQEDPSAET